MEKDDELKGGGNSYTTEFRQYNARLGRWLSLDPLASTYPYNSPYIFVGNSVLNCIDTKGDKIRPVGIAIMAYGSMFRNINEMGFNVQQNSKGFTHIVENEDTKNIQSFSDFKSNYREHKPKDEYGKVVKLSDKELKEHFVLLTAIRSDKEIELQCTVVGMESNNTNSTLNNTKSSDNKGSSAGSGGIYTDNSEFQEFFSSLNSLTTLSQDLSDQLYKGLSKNGNEINPTIKFDDSSVYFGSENNDNVGMIMIDITDKTKEQRSEKLSNSLSTLLNIKIE